MAHDKSCFFTGHRILPAGELPRICVRLDREIENMITKNGVTDFFCGGAMGFDMLAAERVLAARERGSNIQLIMALPCRNQTEKWRNGAEIRRYENILSKADYVFYSSCINQEYYTDAMTSRLTQLTILDMIYLTTRLRMGEDGLQNITRAKEAILEIKKRKDIKK